MKSAMFTEPPTQDAFSATLFTMMREQVAVKGREAVAAALGRHWGKYRAPGGQDLHGSGAPRGSACLESSGRLKLLYSKWVVVRCGLSPFVTNVPAGENFVPLMPTKQNSFASSTPCWNTCGGCCRSRRNSWRHGTYTSIRAVGWAPMRIHGANPPSSMTMLRAGSPKVVGDGAPRQYWPPRGRVQGSTD